MATKIGNIRGPTGLTGATGPNGVNAFTTASAPFTVPPIGNTVSVTVANASWMVLGELLWVDQAGGGVGQPGIMQVQAVSGNLVTLLNISAAPTPLISGDSGNLSRLGSDNLVYTPNALASASARGLLAQLSGNVSDYVGGDNACHNFPLVSTSTAGLARAISGNTTDFIDGTDACQPLAPVITNTRLRSYNSVGNCNFEVDQRNVGNTVSPTTAALFTVDRWFAIPSITATLRTTVGQQTVAAGINVPGTNFAITRSFLRVTLTTAQASLGVSDYFQLRQHVEGPQWRELRNDVHSLQLMVRCSVAPLSFGVVLADPALAVSLNKLCTISTANQWQLIQLPNLPVWGVGNFTSAAGSIGYELGITLLAGTNGIPPANDVWNTSNYYPGATGQSNFAAQAVNSTFDVAFVQHEPGPQCTTLQDKPFTQNYDEALRFYQKTYDYGTAVGTVTTLGIRSVVTTAALASAYGPSSFHKPMAKVPTVTLYDHNNGAANSVLDGASVHHTGANVPTPGSTGFYSIGFTTATTSAMQVYFHYTADTGW